jgi:hypothetical protein
MKYVVLVKVAHSLYHILQPLHSPFEAYIHSHAIFATVCGFARLEVHSFEAAIARVLEHKVHMDTVFAFTGAVHPQECSALILAMQFNLCTNHRSLRVIYGGELLDRDAKSVVEGPAHLSEAAFSQYISKFQLRELQWLGRFMSEQWMILFGLKP